MTVYEFDAKSIDGTKVSLSAFDGNVLLIVNVASQCGFTPQYDGLEKLYKKYKNEGFMVLGFPCNQFGGQEPGTDSEIKSFCQTNYGVTFPLFARIDVNGPNAHPLYDFLKEAKPGILGTERIKWNFTKFLIDRQGNVIKRYAPQEKPQTFEEDIEAALNRQTV
jgi:glutathione peroxidase